MDLLWTISRKDLPLLAGFVSPVLVYAAYRIWSKRKLALAADAHLRTQTPPIDLPNEKSRQAEKEREPGEWIPVKFDYPRLEASKEHFSGVKPIPYRPFRWGDYHVTMGIRNMLWDEWIELDREFAHFHRICEYRIRTRGERLLQVHPAQPGIVDSGHAAVKELAYELAEYLSRRHPDVYRVSRHAVSKREGENGWYGEGRIRSVTIVPFRETYDLDKDEPLKVARMLMQEDFTIMLEGTDGRYYCQAGAVCIPGMWRLEDKMGMPLEEIHLSGHVPQYKSKLEVSLGRFFRRMGVDKPVVRNNYSFQVVAPPSPESAAPGSLGEIDPDELAWSVTMNGCEDSKEFERVKYAGDEDPESPVKVETPATVETIRLRVERQTLRRLPRTGAIVFTIRIYQTRLDEVVREPGVPGRMASAIRSWPEDVARYKGRGAYEAILPLLDQCHAEQVEKGLAIGDVKKTNYPF